MNVASRMRAIRNPSALERAFDKVRLISVETASIAGTYRKIFRKKLGNTREVRR
jgi:hypothetical protein